MHPGPPHLTCQPQLCQLPSALPKPRGSDVLPIWFLGKDEDKGRDSVMLVHPAVSRWQEEAIPTVSHTYLCLSPSGVPKENLNRAVNVAGSAEGYRFREAGCRLAWLRTFWLGRNQVSTLKAGGAPRPCETANQIDGVVYPGAWTSQNGWLLSLSLRDSVTSLLRPFCPVFRWTQRCVHVLVSPRKSANFTRQGCSEPSCV